MASGQYDAPDEQWRPNYEIFVILRPNMGDVRTRYDIRVTVRKVPFLTECALVDVKSCINGYILSNPSGQYSTPAILYPGHTPFPQAVVHGFYDDYEVTTPRRERIKQEWVTILTGAL